MINACQAARPLLHACHRVVCVGTRMPRKYTWMGIAGNVSCRRGICNISKSFFLPPMKPKVIYELHRALLIMTLNEILFPGLLQRIVFWYTCFLLDQLIPLGDVFELIVLLICFKNAIFVEVFNNSSGKVRMILITNIRFKKTAEGFITYSMTIHLRGFSAIIFKVRSSNKWLYFSLLDWITYQ